MHFSMFLCGRTGTGIVAFDPEGCEADFFIFNLSGSPLFYSSIHLLSDVFANFLRDNSKEPLVQPDQQFLFLFAIRAILFVYSLNSCLQNYALYCYAALYHMV